MNSGIYKIENKLNKKIYIGSSINIKNRFKGHKKSLNLKNHSNKKLQSSWNKYGENNFDFFILENCEKEKLVEREQFYLDTLLLASENSQKFDELGYNISRKAYSLLGYKHSESAKEKLRKPLTEERKRKIGLGNKGKTISQETKDKISIANSGREQSNELKERKSKKMKGIPHNRKTSQCLKGKTYEEIMGIEKAKLRKEKVSKNYFKPGKGSRKFIEIIKKTRREKSIREVIEMFNNNSTKRIKKLIKKRLERLGFNTIIDLIESIKK